MKKYTKYFKNKFIFTTCLFFVYILFLDDIDIFTIINQNRKLSHLEESKIEISEKLLKTKTTLKELKYSSNLESYAREEKLFKKDDEDIFIISYE
ncbi:MAG: septum formation initiator family protein [Crocinitomicaceae bacterium]|nr:MAG: septum formation initiator family protein [Crocinitomicaceae bacterium]